MEDFIDGSHPSSRIIPDTKSTKAGTNDLCLGNLSDRDKPWDKHRGNSDKVANHYRGTEEFGQYATCIDF